MKRISAAFLLGAALTLVLSAAQAALLRPLGGGRLPVELPLVLLTWAGLEAALEEGIAAALGVGYLLDVFAGTPQGLLVFLSVLVLLGSRAARSSLAVHGRRGFALLVGAGTLLLGGGALLLTRITAPPEAPPAASLLGRLVLEALLTAGAAALVHPLLVRLARVLAREPEPGLLTR
jgi:rod shape-determining protein MreD